VGQADAPSLRGRRARRRSRCAAGPRTSRRFGSPGDQ